MARHVANQAEKAMGDKLLKDIEGSKEDFIEGAVTSASNNDGTTEDGFPASTNIDQSSIPIPIANAPLPPAPADGGSIAGAVAAVSSSPSGSDPLQPGPNTASIPAAPTDESKKTTKHCWFYFWCRTY